MKEKVVLAFSGGLDTSFCVKYLAEEKRYDVYTAVANTGGFSDEELKVIEEKAYRLGAVKHVAIDVTQEYYEKSLKMQQHEWKIINFLEGRDKQDRAVLILPGYG